MSRTVSATTGGTPWTPPRRRSWAGVRNWTSKGEWSSLPPGTAVGGTGGNRSNRVSLPTSTSATTVPSPGPLHPADPGRTLRILVVGARGQLGRDLVQVLRQAGHQVVGTGHADLDITSMATVR